MLADTMFNFNFTGNGTEYGLGAVPLSGSGVFDTQETSIAGQYLIVGVTGTTQGQTITKLDAPGTHYTNDNLLFYTPGGILPLLLIPMGFRMRYQVTLAAG